MLASTLALLVGACCDRLHAPIGHQQAPLLHPWFHPFRLGRLGWDARPCDSGCGEEDVFTMRHTCDCLLVVAISTKCPPPACSQACTRSVPARLGIWSYSLLSLLSSISHFRCCTVCHPLPACIFAWAVSRVWGLTLLTDSTKRIRATLVPVMQQQV